MSVDIIIVLIDITYVQTALVNKEYEVFLRVFQISIFFFP